MVAAGGETSAVVFNDVGDQETLRAAVSRTGAPAWRATTFGLRTRRNAGPGPLLGGPASPKVSVGPRGDVLSTYNFGPFGTLHAAALPTARAAFDPPLVLNTFGPEVGAVPGHTGAGIPGVLTGVSGTVQWVAPPGGATAIAAPARLTVGKPRTNRLGARVLSVPVACSTACQVSVNATLTIPGRKAPYLAFSRIKALEADTPARLTIRIPARAARAYKDRGRARIRFEVVAATRTGVPTYKTLAVAVG